MRYLFLFVLSGWVFAKMQAQPMLERDFVTQQRAVKRVDEAFAACEDSLKAEFAAKGFTWPAKYMYLRSFKLDSKLEVWIKQKASDPYRKLKTYRICALAGALGPKRFEGDYQVPEGFYYINEFKPNSSYHLALGINYPNPSDRVLSDSKHPGDGIYIHGSCVTVGCIPLTDPIIEELYVLAAATRAAGQDFIPIHVFPVVFKKNESYEMLQKFIETHSEYKSLANTLQKVYYFFEEKRQLPALFINGGGEYIMLQDFTIPKRPVPPPEPVKFTENSVARKQGKKTIIPETAFFTYVNSQAAYPGGMQAFQLFLDQLSIELSVFLPEEKTKAYISVSFVVDENGKVSNVEVGKSANNEINNHVIERFEKMAYWKPATRQDKAVPVRLEQSLMVEAKPIPVKKPVVIKKDDDD